MTTGTENEVPTCNKLMEESCVKELYEMRLLQHNDHLFLGVSSDGIEVIIGGEHDSQIRYIETKTRCAPRTIQ